MHVSRHVVFNEEVFPTVSSSISSPAASSEFQSFPFVPEFSQDCITPIPVINSDIVVSDGSPAPQISESTDVLPECIPITEQQVVDVSCRDSSLAYMTVDTPAVEVPSSMFHVTTEPSVVNNGGDTVDTVVPSFCDIDHRGEGPSNVVIPSAGEIVHSTAIENVPSTNTNRHTMVTRIQWHGDGTIISCSMQELTTLVLSQNYFSGSLPDGLGNSLVSLQKLNLSYNSFGGSIPSEIPASLGNLSEKVYIDLSYNNLTGSSNANSQTSFHNPFQSSSGNSIESGKDGHSSSHQVIKAVAFVIVGVCFIGFMFSYWYKKSSVCNGVQKVTSYRLEEKLMIGRDIFCFMKKDNDTLSENMEQCNFVPIDTEVDFDLEQLLKASTFLLGKSSNGILYKVVLNNGLAVAVRRLGDGGGQRLKEF
ncbi:hypothetical protein V6N11_077010 [Hibiscus sabdariffa]|uniref:Uncharacterized protein n=1 Tax=Hibiscus sabdariffa TaxID=183260 RepID=A0ABR2TCP9_9ROSI